MQKGECPRCGKVLSFKGLCSACEKHLHKLIREAGHALDEGHLARAQTLLKEALAIHPTNTDVLASVTKYQRLRRQLNAKAKRLKADRLPQDSQRAPAPQPVSGPPPLSSANPKPASDPTAHPSVKPVTQPVSNPPPPPNSKPAPQPIASKHQCPNCGSVGNDPNQCPRCNTVFDVFYTDRAYASLNRHQAKRAERMFRQALRCNPKNENAASGLKQAVNYRPPTGVIPVAPAKKSPPAPPPEPEKPRQGFVQQFIQRRTDREVLDDACYDLINRVREFMPEGIKANVQSFIVNCVAWNLAAYAIFRPTPNQDALSDFVKRYTLRLVRADIRQVLPTIADTASLDRMTQKQQAIIARQIEQRQDKIIGFIIKDIMPNRSTISPQRIAQVVYDGSFSKEDTDWPILGCILMEHFSAMGSVLS